MRIIESFNYRFGSIGKRHYDVLSKLSEVQSIDLVTKQILKIKFAIKSWKL